jgi:hypothetical protein
MDDVRLERTDCALAGGRGTQMMLTNPRASLPDRVRELVGRAIPVPLERVTLESSLHRDLAMDSESAGHFFAAFALEFGVDLTGLDVARHFDLVWTTSWGWLFFITLLPPAGIGYAVGLPLPLAILPPLMFLWLGNRLEQRIRRGNSTEIRVKDLVIAAQNKRWQKPDHS